MPQVLKDVTVSDDTRNAVSKLRVPNNLPRDIDEREELRQRYRARAKESLYFLAKAVLGYKDLTLRTHKPFADFLQNLDNKKTLDLMPRGVFKTTVGTISFSIWYLLNFPDHYILIANQIAGHAERMLLEIENHLDGSNPMMNWLFPEYIKPHDRYKPWSSHQMTVPCRNIISGTPSIMSIGVGSKAESLHFHVIINDDLIGAKAMSSTAEMSEAIAWHDYSISLFVSPAHGIERAHGTRWSLDDLYSIIKNDTEYEVYERAAVDPETNELLFPELLTHEFLRKTREKNFAVYTSQYLNQPDNPQVLDFRVGWLKRYNLLPDSDNGPYCEADGEKFYVKDMDVRLFVDPAASGDVDSRFADTVKKGRAKKANNAVEVWGVHGSGRYFLLDLWAGRGFGESPELEVASKMLDMFVRWRGYIRRGYVESYGAQRALITVFNMLCKQHGLRFPMEEIGRGNIKAKKVRIRSYLGPSAQNGQVYVRSIHDQFIYEFSRFPQSDLYDTLDAAAWAFYALRPPSSSVDAEQIARLNKRALKRLTYRRSRTY